MGFLSGWADRNLEQGDPRAWVPIPFEVQSSTGVRVDQDSSLGLTAVWAAVRILSEGVASLPLLIYRRLPDGGKERLDSHYLFRILHDEPNGEMTSFEFREAMQGHLCLWGNAYAEIQRNGSGRPVALWPLRPDRTRPIRADGGSIAYEVWPPGAGRIVLSGDRVFHLRGFGANGIVGYDPIRVHAESIGHGLALQEYGARFFGNNARPGGVIQHPAKMSDKAVSNLRMSWEEMHRGLSQSHRVAILEEGATWQSVGIPPEAAQFIQARKLSVSEVARIFNIKPHLLGDLDRATFSNIEQQSLEHVIYSLMPWLRRWEQRILSSLTVTREDSGVFPEFLVEGLLRGDIKTRYDAYATGRNWGWLSANDIRRLENMNPVGPAGDQYLVPMNMAPAGAAPPPPNGAISSGHLGEESSAVLGRTWYMQLSPPSTLVGHSEKRDSAPRLALRGSFRSLFRGAYERVLRRERSDIMRQAEKMLRRRDAIELGVWIEVFWKEHDTFVKEVLGPVVKTYSDSIRSAAAAEVGRDVSADQVEGFVDAYISGSSARWIGSSSGQIREIVNRQRSDEGAILGEMDERFEEWQETRLDAASDRETVRGEGAVSRFVWMAAGVVRFAWRAVGKSCPMCVRLNGRVVGRQAPFSDIGETFDLPGLSAPFVVPHRIFHPPLHRGCDCHMVAT